jgi:hypothetical protein
MKSDIGLLVQGRILYFSNISKLGDSLIVCLEFRTVYRPVQKPKDEIMLSVLLFLTGLVEFGVAFLRTLRFHLPVLIPATAPETLIIRSSSPCNLDTEGTIK